MVSESNRECNLVRAERSIVLAMCGVLLIDRKGDNDIMLSLGLNETIHWLTVGNGYVLRREDGHFLRRKLNIMMKGRRMEGREKRTSKKQVEEESVIIDLSREDAFCRSKWSIN